MAFGDRVQTANGTGTSGDSSATLPGAATAGNLIVYAVARSTSHALGGAWGAPSGFTDLPNSGIQNGNMGSAAWYKIAAGGETAISVADGVNAAGNWCSTVTEYEGPFEAAPLGQVAESEANIANVVTSQTSGTTGTTSQADKLALAYFGFDSGNNVGTRGYTNSFAEDTYSSSGARASLAVAKRVLTATGTFETTVSHDGTGDETYGAIVTFKKAAGGGVTTKRYSLTMTGVG